MPTWIVWAVPAVSGIALAILWRVSPDHARTLARMAAGVWIASTALAIPLYLHH